MSDFGYDPYGNRYTTSGYRDSVAYEGALETPGVTAEALGRLVDQRLLRVEERSSGQRRIELTHDVLTDVVRESRDQQRLREQQERTEPRTARG